MEDRTMKIRAKAIASLMLTLMISFNTTASLASAEEKTEDNKTTSSTSGFVSRFPVGSGSAFGPSSGSSAGGNGTTGGDDSNWVDYKDDWRHGIVSQGSEGGSGSGSGSSSGSNGVGTSKGSAAGDYSIDLCDGKYYWYHQMSSGTDNCKYCGTWTMMTWGSGGTLGADGCAIYSSAILISNLTGQEITPDKWLTDLGCTINAEKTYCDLSTSPYLENNHTIASGTTIAEVISEKYGLSHTDVLGDYDKTKMKEKVDEVLDKGGMIWYRYSASSSNGSSWPTYRADTHYICIRSRDDKGYYVLDESMQPDDPAHNEPISFDTLYNYKYPDTEYIIGFWNENGKSSGASSGSSSSSGSGGSNVSSSGATGAWYGKGTQISKYSNKVDLGDGFYIYDGLPWGADANTWACDCDTMLYDLFQYVKGVSKTKKATATVYGDDVTAEQILSKSSRMHADTTGASPDGGEWKSGSGGYYVEIDGVKCAGSGTVPAIMSYGYNAGFGAYNKDTGENYWNVESDFRKTPGHGERKMAYALYEKSTKKIWYIPTTPISAKGHSFPGGVAQTNLTTYDQGSVRKSKLNSDGTLKEFAVWKAGSGTDWAKRYEYTATDGLMDVMNEEVLGYSCWDVAYDIGEFWYTPTPVVDLINSGEYDVVGAVVWKLDSDDNNNAVTGYDG
jgi:hypothetical protein